MDGDLSLSERMHCRITASVIDLILLRSRQGLFDDAQSKFGRAFERLKNRLDFRRHLK
jgi:hypothetical protein